MLEAFLWEDGNTYHAAPRLNLIVGRNGSGKTWLLDSVWRGLTEGEWRGLEGVRRKPDTVDPRWEGRIEDIVVYVHEEEVRVHAQWGGRNVVRRHGPWQRGYGPDGFVRDVLAHRRSYRCVVLIDEVEAHMHPEIQRKILPGVLEYDAPYGGLQVFATTHAPLVLASAEPLWDDRRDKLWQCVNPYGGRYDLHERPWAMQGDVTNWLVSDTFGLRQARSLEAERAIEHAQAWMRGEADAIPEDRRSEEALTSGLKRVLAGHDPFWARWSGAR